MVNVQVADFRREFAYETGLPFKFDSDVKYRFWTHSVCTSNLYCDIVFGGREVTTMFGVIPAGGVEWKTYNITIRFKC